MSNARKNKYNSLLKEDKNKLLMKFNVTNLNAFCCYVLSENNSVHRSGLSNLRSLLSDIDTKVFEGNKQLLDRYHFCLDAISARLDKNLTKREFIINDVLGVVGNKYPDLDINSFGEINTDSIIWIESELIAKCLDASLMNNQVIDLYQECQKYINAAYEDKGPILESLGSKIDSIHSQRRRNHIDEDEDSVFILSKPEGSLDRIWNHQQSPAYKLRTGIQMLNKILGGGFEGSRVYCFFGLPGEGKTVTLVNLLLQLRKYNWDYECKDKTKKPCIVLLTMENFIREEVQTLYNIAIDKTDIGDKPLTKVIEEVLSISSSDYAGYVSNIDIVIKFKPINSVDTDYLYKLTEDLNDNGYEVICMIQDYIMRIRPVEGNNADERIRLGNIINEFKNYAMFYNIPVITASQLNRNAATSVDKNRNDGKVDIMVESVGRSNIGESSRIDMNLDASIILLPYEEKDSKWMSFKLTKKRYNAQLEQSDYIFFHPFDSILKAKLQEDFGRVAPLSKHSLIYDGDTNPAAKIGNKKNGKSKKETKETNINDPAFAHRFNINSALEKNNDIIVEKTDSYIFPGGEQAQQLRNKENYVVPIKIYYPEDLDDKKKERIINNIWKGYEEYRPKGRNNT